MGANDPPDMDEVGMKATKDARPIHRVYVDGFFMDKTDVTNVQFAKFVKANPAIFMQLGGGILKGAEASRQADKNRAIQQQNADAYTAKVKQSSYGSQVANYTPIINTARK